MTRSIGSIPARVLIAAGFLIATATSSSAADLSRSIKPSPDGHFLTQPNGEPFFWLGDTALSLFTDLTFEEANTYLDSRAKNGFTVVMAVATGIAMVRKINDPNRYGEKPFRNDDVRSPNERYWNHVDRVIQAAAEKGVRIALLPTWGQVTMTKGSAALSFDEQTAKVHGKWIANRYRNSGITWVMGGDTNPIWSRDWPPSSPLALEDYTGIYDAMAMAIREELGEQVLITYYPPCCSYPGTAQPRASLYLGHKKWLNMNMLQSSHFDDPTYFINKAGFQFGWRGPFNYQTVREEYDDSPTRPVLDGEPAAEDIPIDTGAFCWDLQKYESAPRYTDYDTRLRAYHSVFSGAAGAQYTNNNYSWYFYDPSRKTPSKCGARHPWTTALNAAGATQMRHIKALMLSRPYLTRIPDQSVVKSDLGEGASHVSATRSRGGDYMMVYLPEGQPVTIDMNKLSGTHAVASWFDPRTGVARVMDGTFPANRPTMFVPPSKGAGHDWILVIDDATREFPSPGKLPAADTDDR